MGKKVKVVTACGDEHFYDFDQEVKSVEVIEKPKPRRGYMVHTKDGDVLMAFWAGNGYCFIETEEDDYELLDPTGKRIGYIYKKYVGKIT